MFSVKNAFKNRTVGFYMGVAAAILAIVSAILYIIMDGSDRTFTTIGFALMIVGGVVELLVIFSELSFASLVSTVLYIAGFAFTLNVALPSLSDVWNGVTFIGGNAKLGMIFAATFFLCAVIGIASCFMPERKYLPQNSAPEEFAE